MPIQRKGMRALQIWCSRVTADYPCVEITDLTTSFRDGLAFVAIIHHFRPDLIKSPNELNKEDVFDNNALAFNVAEEMLDIPALLDPQDMVECQDPDKFSVVTYVSQFYHLFKDADDSRSSPSPNTSLLMRSSESENDSLISHSSESESTTPLGTPTPNRNPVRPVFNQAELIAKYGEEIFCNSEKKSEVAISERRTSRIKVSSLCSDLENMGRIVGGGR